MLATVLNELWPGIDAAKTQQIVDAYAGGARGPVPTGMSNEDFVEQQIKLEIRTAMLQAHSRTQRTGRDTFEANLKRDFPA